MTKFDDGIVQGYIDHEAKRVHFYGAWQAEDWAHLAVFFPIVWKGLWGVHAGIAKLADGIMGKIEIPNGYTISGHSMGGMIAVYVAWAKDRQGQSHTVQTAGTPRCLWGIAGLQAKKLQVQAYAYSGDNIPHIVPVFLGWTRAGKIVEIKSDVVMPKAHEPSEYARWLPWVNYPADTKEDI